VQIQGDDNKLRIGPDLGNAFRLTRQNFEQSKAIIHRTMAIVKIARLTY
jgi:hypothetical protein